MNGEIVIVQSDNSGNMCVTDIETYIRMGREHTRKDEEVDWERISKA